MTPEAWAHYMRNTPEIGLRHVVVETTPTLHDQFGVAKQLYEVTANSLNLWKLLTTSHNTESERTHIPILVQNPGTRAIGGANVLTRSDYRSRPYLYGSPQELGMPEANESHRRVDALTGLSASPVNASAWFSGVREAAPRSCLLLEDSASIRPFVKLHEAARRECFSTLRTLGLARQVESAKVTLTERVDDYLARNIKLSAEDPVEVFLTQNPNLIAALDAKIDASIISELARPLADRLKEIYSPARLRSLLIEVMPQAILARDALVAYYARNNASLIGTIPDRELVLRAAQLELLMYNVDANKSDIANSRIRIDAAWLAIQALIETILDQFNTQLRLSGGLDIRIKDYASGLTQMRKLFVELRLPHVPDPLHAEFEAWLESVRRGEDRGVPVNFFDANETNRLLLELSGTQIFNEFAAYIAEVERRLSRLSFTIENGQMVPASEFEIPEFVPSGTRLSRREMARAVSELYCIFFFELWIGQDVLPLQPRISLREYFEQTTRPRTENVALRCLVWAGRTLHFQQADALMYAIVAAGDLDKLLNRIVGAWLLELAVPLPPGTVNSAEYIRNLQILASPRLELVMAIDALDSGSQKRLEARQILREFVQTVLAEGAVVNSLNENTSDLFELSFRSWVKALQRYEFRRLANDALALHLRSPEASPVLELKVPDVLRSLLTDKIMVDRRDPAVHTLYDSFIVPTLRRLAPNAKVVQHLSDRRIVPPALQQFLSEMRRLGELGQFDGVAFMPLITTDYLEGREATLISDAGRLCQAISRWEALNSVEILSTRWANPEVDSMRRQNNLQENSYPIASESVLAALQILARDAANVRFERDDQPGRGYIPMFDGPVAFELEVAFRSGTWSRDPVDRADLSVIYATEFGTDIRRWVPDKIRRARGVADIDEAFIPQALRSLAGFELIVALALRPLIGVFESLPEGLAMLRDIVKSQVNSSIVPETFTAFTQITPRTLASMEAKLQSEWESEKLKGNSLISQLLATTTTPSSPFGFDLYMIKDRKARREEEHLLGWALWDNRSGFVKKNGQITRGDASIDLDYCGELLYIQTKTRTFVSDIKQRGEVLMMRGLVDAVFIDGMQHMITEPARTLQILEPRVEGDEPYTYAQLPRIHYPIKRFLMHFYIDFRFAPAFPYRSPRIRGSLNDFTYNPTETELQYDIMIPNLPTYYRDVYAYLARHFTLGVDEEDPAGLVNVSPRLAAEPSPPEVIEAEERNWTRDQWTVTNPGKRRGFPRPLVVLQDIVINGLTRELELALPPIEPAERTEAPLPAQPQLSFQAQYRLLYNVTD